MLVSFFLSHFTSDKHSAALGSWSPDETACAAVLKSSSGSTTVEETRDGLLAGSCLCDKQECSGG